MCLNGAIYNSNAWPPSLARSQKDSFHSSQLLFLGALSHFFTGRKFVFFLVQAFMEVHKWIQDTKTEEEAEEKREMEEEEKESQS